jgi:hypothetical protein
MSLIGAISFDPNVRGLLVVLTGTVVLMGSVYIVLATNMGARMGFLVAMAGFFSWMFLMSSIWVIYGIGLKGRDPEWVPAEINLTRETNLPLVPEMAQLPVEDDIPGAAEMPIAADVLDEYPLMKALALAAEGEDFSPKTLTKLKTIVEPWILVSAEGLADVVAKVPENAATFVAAHPDVEATLNGDAGALLDTVHQQADDLRAEIEEPIGDWCLLTEADPRRGDAQASADAALIEKDIFGSSTSTSDYIVKDVFLFGGKEPCEPINELSTVDRTFHRVYTTFQIKNPKLLSAVTLQKTVDVTVEPGEAPPPATIDDDASTVTVVMVRNLGNRRFIPFTIALVSLAGFIIFTTLLHYRDKRFTEMREAFAGDGKGG